ncbi:hypothetical protein F5Y12DRAFT_90811 [Xylaria sp. FL1777]|nr:hypothetical protein F5Y12DRAFT_90811 [Xylaria sp. FL1777]
MGSLTSMIELIRVTSRRLTTTNYVPWATVDSCTFLLNALLLLLWLPFRQTAPFTFIVPHFWACHARYLLISSQSNSPAKRKRRKEKKKKE